MQVRSIFIENFRDLRRAELSLGSTTVLIGENDCGRSRILESLFLVLSGGSSEFEFRSHHFCCDPEGKPDAARPIRIVLTFIERTAGEWLTAAHQPIHKLLLPNQCRPQELKLEVVADPNSVMVHWNVSSSAGRASDDESRGLLAWLREMNPIVWMPQGLIVDDRSRKPAGLRNAEAQRLADLVESHYGALVGGSTKNVALDVEAGFQAAQNLIAQSSKHVAPPERRSTWLWEEMARSSSIASSPRAALPVQPTVAYKIGWLLFVGALVRVNIRRLAPGAGPLIVIENPESHLHPMTLASVWSLIDRLKWQKIVATHSGLLLSEAPLQSIRRITKAHDVVRVFQVRDRTLSHDEIRRFRYHVRARRGAAMFARCWLLVEGETEFWILPELAQVLGYSLDSEGIACVEFAQCGVPPLIKAAHELGIEWHLLADGDQAGRNYKTVAERFCTPNQRPLRITMLREQDIEHCFWHSGYSRVIHQVARPGKGAKTGATRLIQRAIDKTSKPYLALRLLEAVASTGPAGVPAMLRRVIESCIQLSRGISTTGPPLQSSGR